MATAHGGNTGEKEAFSCTFGSVLRSPSNLDLPCACRIPDFSTSRYAPVFSADLGSPPITTRALTRLGTIIHDR
jgi:hypothetical protein